MVPNFKEFFHSRMAELTTKRKNILLREMSLKLDDPNFGVLDSETSRLNYYEYYKKHGDFVEKVALGGKTYEVYRMFDSILVFLADDRYAAATVEFEENPKGGIKMIAIDKMKAFRNLMDYIFVDYLLPRYGQIESDDVHTVGGFKFYQKLAGMQDVYGKYDFFIRGPKGLKKVTNPKQMETTYGYDEKHQGYTYVLKKK